MKQLTRGEVDALAKELFLPEANQEQIDQFASEFGRLVKEYWPNGGMSARAIYWAMCVSRDVVKGAKYDL